MRTVAICLALTLGFSLTTQAQQSEQFGDISIHYNAINTSQLPQQVAQAYGIKRSSSRALLNITVLDTASGDSKPLRASIKASARNLTGQSRNIDMREVNESDEAIYYIGEFRVNNMETFDFRVDVMPSGAKEMLELRFRQQFYTE